MGVLGVFGCRAWLAHAVCDAISLIKIYKGWLQSAKLAFVPRHSRPLGAIAVLV